MQTNYDIRQTDPYPPDLATLFNVLGYLELLAGALFMIYFWSNEAGYLAVLSITTGFISAMFVFAIASVLTYLNRIHSTLKGIYNK